MSNQYFEAYSYGIGELITRKKKFQVPAHQRDFAWTSDDVEQFLSDIFDAVNRGATNYFLGLIVLVGPENGTWTILDGQQRLATTTMLFAAIRSWLSEHGFEQDSKQIEAEFIGVRRLGEEPLPRITLNVMNRRYFEDFVVRVRGNDEITECRSEFPANSSNGLLLDATLTCRKRVREWADMISNTPQDRVQALYALANYLESQVHVACMELTNEADAYVIFESLNHRGNALSALDLVKNFIFSVASSESHETLSFTWQQMSEYIIEFDADDFLKVVWTTIEGRVQRGDLFRRIRARYTNGSQVLDLAELLAQRARLYSAIDDATHPVWSDYPADCAYCVSVLERLRSRQTRAVRLAALVAKLEADTMTRILQNLVVLTVRYQTVGRRRTGFLEIECAKIAHEIAVATADTTDITRWFRHVAPDDEEFHSDFLKYVERNSRRSSYVLAALEAHRRSIAILDFVEGSVLRPRPNALVHHVLPKKPTREVLNSVGLDEPQYNLLAHRIGNQVLIPRGSRPPEKVENFLEWVGRNASEFRLTLDVSAEVRWDQDSLGSRQKALAELAVSTWSVIEV